MNDTTRVEIIECERHFSNIKLDDFFLERAQSIEMKSQITTKHKVENHKEIFIILKSESQVADEWRFDLFE